MKDFNEILSHVNAIGEIDQRRESSGFERRRAIGALACHIADELIAGRPAPGFENSGRFTRIDGMAPALANELVSQHDMAIAHRTHLAERFEADGGENGAKAAAILRGMNEAADSKSALLRARGENFTGHQARGVASDEKDVSDFKLRPYHHALIAMLSGSDTLERVRCGMTKDESERMRKQLSGLWGAWVSKASEVPEAPAITAPAGITQGLLSDRIQRYRAHEARRRERSLAEEKIRAAELRGFYQGRGVALNIVLNRLQMMPGLHEDGRAVLRAVSESIAMMQKEG